MLKKTISMIIPPFLLGILFSLLFSINISFSQTKNWYVNKSAIGLNNGSSWSNAWNELNQINWNLINPGDTIFISGGVGSLVYTTTMTINKSGLPNKFIVITKGKDSQNNGEVIIDGQGTTNYGISLSKTSAGGLNYIKISQLSFQNHSSSILVKLYSNVIYLDSLKIRGQRGQGAILITGWNSNNDHNLIDSVFIRYCDIRSDYQTTEQTDNIYVQYANNIFILDNHLEQLNTVGSSHNDCIQTAWYLGNQTIARNFLYNAKEDDSQGIMLNTCLAGYETIVHNNVIYSGGNGTAYYEYPIIQNNVGDCKIFNNTFYVRGGTGYVSQAAIIAHKNVEIKNNIFVSNGVGAVHYNTTLTTFFDADNNLLKSSDDRYTVVINGYGKTLSYWQTLKGQDYNSMVADPLFVNVNNKDLSVQENSVSIDVGATLSNQYNFSFNELYRPQGIAWDIGAFEFLDTNLGDHIWVSGGWNIISIPKFNQNMAVGNLLPTATSPVYSFSGTSFLSVDILQNGNGYITKFDYPQYIFIGGEPINLPIQVSEGWNLIGPFNENVLTSNVLSTPPGIINSGFFELYGNQLQISNILKPGKGYWVKVEANGVINLNSSGLGKNLNEDLVVEIDKMWGKIKITDNDGECITLYIAKEVTRLELYDLPPTAPGSNYDVRFASGRFVELIDNNPEILIASNKYPVTIKSEGISISLKDNINGYLFNQDLEDGKDIKIFDSRINSIIVTEKINSEMPVPVSYQLFQNYPNPFNPSTVISLQTPVDGWQTLKIFDVLGNEIVTLVNEYREAGYYEVEFNPTSPKGTSSIKKLASGIYFYRLQVGYPSSSSPKGQAGQGFVETKKMILLK